MCVFDECLAAFYTPLRDKDFGFVEADQAWKRAQHVLVTAEHRKRLAVEFVRLCGSMLTVFLVVVVGVSKPKSISWYGREQNTWHHQAMG